MEYQHFITLLLGYKKFSEDMSSLYEIGFDLSEGKFNLAHPIELMLGAAIQSHYGDKGWDWVSWFIWESHYGTKDFSEGPTYGSNEDGTTYEIEDRHSDGFGAHDADGKPICYSFDSLWEYLEKECKINKN